MQNLAESSADCAGEQAPEYMIAGLFNYEGDHVLV